MLCAGAVRTKNTMNILMKNVMDACVGSLCFYVFGFAFSYGSTSNPFIGASNFALSEFTAGDADWDYFLSQWAFVAATASIVSGSVAERTNFWAYLGYCSFLCSFVYPAVAHWAWAETGWLSPFSSSPLLGTGLFDFAGSGVVHMTGGFAGLMGAALVGPRMGRFDKDGVVQDMPGHSATLVVLGTFCLWFGWYGFNPGSMLEIDSAIKAEVVGRVAVTTTLSAGAGGVSALIFQFSRTGMWNLLDVCNGLLCGLVSITAGCAVLEPWAAIIAGAFGALIFFGAVSAIRKFRIDDPLEAAPMHGACGMWGVLITGLLATQPYTEQVYGEAVAAAGYGAFYPGGGGNLLACQLIAILSIAAWTVGLMGPFFFAFRQAGILRCTAAEEMVGLDISKHGGSAYNPEGNPKTADSKHEITILDLPTNDDLKKDNTEI
eukprot:jgi/Tetstr1/437246/TSEL_025976.t1